MKTVDLKKAVMRIAKELSDNGQFHEDSEPQEIAYILRELVIEYNALEKKHNKLLAQLRKLMESCDENI